MNSILVSLSQTGPPISLPSTFYLLLSHDKEREREREHYNKTVLPNNFLEQFSKYYFVKTSTKSLNYKKIINLII